MFLFSSNKSKGSGEDVATPDASQSQSAANARRSLNKSLNKSTVVEPIERGILGNPVIAGDPDDTKIVMVLDASGSMNTVKTDIVGSVNSFLDAQKTIIEDKPTFSLLQFGHVTNWRFVDAPLETIPEFKEHMYEIAGGTPLYDSIGAAIQTFDRFNDVSLVIITDGQDNTSTIYSCDRIKKMLAQKKAEQNWDIIYLCADASGFAAGAAMGVTSNFSAPQAEFAKNIRCDMSSAVQFQRNSKIASRSAPPQSHS